MNIVYVVYLPDMPVVRTIFPSYRFCYEGRDASLWIYHMDSRNKL